MPVVCTKCGIELETYEDICTHKYHCKYGTQPTSTNSDYMAALLDAFTAGRSSVISGEKFDPAWNHYVERLNSAKAPNCT